MRIDLFTIFPEYLEGPLAASLLGKARVPIVLTGAMRPWIMRNTDALQNLTEALIAVQVLAPGVYVCMHNQVLQFPGVRKDRERGTFVKDPPRP